MTGQVLQSLPLPEVLFFKQSLIFLKNKPNVNFLFFICRLCIFLSRP